MQLCGKCGKNRKEYYLRLLSEMWQTRSLLHYTGYVQKNLTLTVDESLLRAARKVAIDRNTSERNTAAVDIGPIVSVIAHAVAVFGDEHKASHWLATPLPLLDNRSPTQVLEGAGGADLVEQVLTRIEHNIPS
jgi:putative toxin-antitoxin system antitoxin component (TIGR02293 family)